MRVAVLGSSGQIGAYLTEHLTKKGHLVREFDVVNGYHEDMTHIPNVFLRNVIMESDFVFFLAFDVGGSRYLKKYQHTFDFINNNTRMMVNAFGLLEKYKKPFVFASSQMSNLSFSSYGLLKNVGELYTKSLGGLVTKFWNVYGIEKDYEKSHVITDFIRKGFESGVIDMITDGQEEREFLYAQDCCDALETVMNNYKDFNSDDELHVTSFSSIKIIDIAQIIQQKFAMIGKKIDIKPSIDTDTVQQNSKNVASKYLTNWWKPITSLDDGISKVFASMKKNYD
jgi:nucleoside-diphosphate-sugar epimerase